MDKLDIKMRIAEITATIINLKEENNLLTKELMRDSDDFVEKFKAWWNNDDLGSHENWVVDRNKFPLIRTELDDWDINRHMKYSINEIVGEDDFYAIEDTEDFLKEYGQEEYDKAIEKIKPMLEEAMNGDLKSFVYDW